MASAVGTPLKASYKELFLTGTKLGLISFGGPLAAIGIIEREAVEKKRWVDADWFASGVALVNLIPGPSATEMAIYLGYQQAGILGGVLLGVCYIYPAFLIMLALSWAYFRWGMIPAVGGLVYGLTPAAVGVLLWAAWQMARSSIRDLLQVALFAASFALVYYLQWSVAWVILLGGAAGLARSRVRAALHATTAPLWLLFLKTFKAGALLFGGGYVIVPFLAQDFVYDLHWLTPGEFLIAFALGKATPGPLSITATFVGYKAAGLAGACVATLGIFLPGFVFLLALAPLFDRLRTAGWAREFLGGLKAAAVGAILAASADLITQAMPDWTSLGLMAGSVAACFYLETTWVFLGAALIGLGLGLAGRIA